MLKKLIQQKLLGTTIAVGKVLLAKVFPFEDLIILCSFLKSELPLIKANFMKNSKIRK